MAATQYDLSKLGTAECPGCFDAECVGCNGPAPTWQSKPSKAHGVRTSQATEKQIGFIRSLSDTKDIPEGGRPALDDLLNGEYVSKGDASALIDWLTSLPAKPGKTGASEKQESFIRSLLARKLPDVDADVYLAEIPDRKSASFRIDGLKSLPDAQGRVVADAPLEDGIYRDAEGEIFKVYRTVHGANQTVAKRLVTIGTGNAKFEYEGKRPLRHLTPEMKMTLAQAKEFGAVYGVCCNCCATLTDERSIEAGIGPVCAGRFA
jgi:hypothetical protein